MFKRAQVLRITRSVNTATGESVPAGTRVVVLKQEENGSYRCKIQDGNLDNLRGARVLVAQSRLALTHRGRPKGATKAASQPAVPTANTNAV
jgi:hypothetical protein